MKNTILDTIGDLLGITVLVAIMGVSTLVAIHFLLMGL